LPRKDRISLTTAGQILVTEGEPSVIPSAPNEIPGTMTIGFANVPPYPSLTPDEAKIYNRYDYSIQTSMLQTKRYTMADINKLSKRIERLEYYTSLSLLEQATNSLTVRSDSTGQNRFKNGILVDPFKDHSIGNTNDGTYNISIDKDNAEARPTFNQKMTDLWFDTSSSTAVLAGDLILLPHTANNLNQSQKFASKFRSCIQGNVYNYRGVLELNPVGITAPDILQRPTINGNIDNYTNFVGAGSSSKFGTQWSNWTNVGGGKVVSQDSQTALTASSQSSQSFRTTTTSTLAQQQKRVGTTFTISSTESTISTGDYVTDVSIQTYVPSRDVFFRARGMKPNTKLYVFFDNVDVSNYCLNMNPYNGSATRTGGLYKTPAGSYTYVAYDGTMYVHNNDWNGQITSDTFGHVYGVFKIPPNVFKSGELEFKLTDIWDLARGENSVTTQASYNMFCSSLSIQKEKTNLTVRSPVFTAQEVIDTQTVYQNTTDSREWQVQLPPPPKPPDPPAPVIINNSYTTVNTTQVTDNNITVVNVTEVTNVDNSTSVTQVINNTNEYNYNTNVTQVIQVSEVTNVTNVNNVTNVDNTTNVTNVINNNQYVTNIDNTVTNNVTNFNNNITNIDNTVINNITNTTNIDNTVTNNVNNVFNNINNTVNVNNTNIYNDNDTIVNVFVEAAREIVTLPVVEDAYIAPEPPKIDIPVINSWVAEPTAPVTIEYRENGDGTIVPYEVQPPYIEPIMTLYRENGDGTIVPYEVPYYDPVGQGEQIDVTGGAGVGG
jgi:hypothetical protein